jgi:hypothetical protein
VDLGLEKGDLAPNRHFSVLDLIKKGEEPKCVKKEPSQLRLSLPPATPFVEPFSDLHGCLECRRISGIELDSVLVLPSDIRWFDTSW